MKAVGKYIVVENIKNEVKKNTVGLILNDKSREDIRYIKAKILVPGSSVEFVKKDDIIYYDKHAGFDVEIDRKIWKVIKEQDIVIVL
tara:strand:- start:1935 stop:2195 length:261 start_codon:yes stop_codon:yes gene_type:complete